MRNKPSRPKKWLRPLAIERQYQAYVRTVADATNDAIRDLVLPLVNQAPLREDDVGDIPRSSGWFETLRQGLVAALDRLKALPIINNVKRFSQSVNSFNSQQFHAVLRSAYGVDVFQTEPWLTDALTGWEAENVRLITSIPSQALDQLHGKIVARIQQGAGKITLRKDIEETFGVNRNRADLIANDQIGKLNGQLTQERQQGVGVTTYKWRGMLDQRERDSHVDREGQVFRWDTPPPDGHPGRPIRCRCTAEPVLPLLQDLDGLQYTDTLPSRGADLTSRRVAGPRQPGV